MDRRHSSHAPLDIRRMYAIDTCWVQTAVDHLERSGARIDRMAIVDIVSFVFNM